MQDYSCQTYGNLFNIQKCTTKYATKHVLQYGLATTYRDRAYCKENEEKST